jgi:type II secretory pathway pseudopilin PulG
MCSSPLCPILLVIGVASAASVQLGRVLQRRAAEEALLDIGREYRNALISYANATPAGQKRSPSSLQDLLRDPRYPNPRHYLRQLYADPLTGKAKWGVIPMVDGSGIAGVYSLATAQPIKIGNFDAPFQDFTGKTSYRDWQFMAPRTDPVFVAPPSYGELAK